jgi:hypothetical protein
MYRVGASNPLATPVAGGPDWRGAQPLLRLGMAKQYSDARGPTPPAATRHNRATRIHGVPSPGLPHSREGGADAQARRRNDQAPGDAGPV